MPNGDQKICDAVREALKSNNVLDSEQDIQNATKFSIKSGMNRAGILVYNSGKMVVEGVAQI